MVLPLKGKIDRVKGDCLFFQLDSKKYSFHVVVFSTHCVLREILKVKPPNRAGITAGLSMSTMEKQQFVKYLENRCTSGEIDSIVAWFESGAPQPGDLIMLKELWDQYTPSGQFPDETRLEILLDRLHSRIKMTDKPQNSINAGKAGFPVLRKVQFFLLRAAAILLIPLLAALLYTRAQYKSLHEEYNHAAVNTINITAPTGSRTYIELPDGTGVHLNHGSRISYPQQFTGKERNVNLAGEAYFIVAHDPHKPFRVETGNLLITALGTEFNVMAYPGQSVEEATLAEGSVLVEKVLPGKQLQKLRLMEPGQHLRLDMEKNTFRCGAEDIRKYVSWKDGLLVFRHDPLEQIAGRLSRWYNVDFIFRDETLKQYPYTATFVDETLPQIMDLLQMATPLKYEITPRVKNADGTFTKSKVVISKK
jgi:transmembrane sensor